MDVTEQTAEFQARLKKRACTRCATAKAKCSGPGETRPACERCHRMGRECIFVETDPGKRRKRKNATRVEKLEEKVDSLLALLTAEREGKKSGPSTISSRQNGDASGDSPQAMASSSATSRLDDDSPPQRTPPVSCWPNDESSIPDFGISDLDIVDRGLISPEQSEEWLKTFHKITPEFPFVVLDPRISAYQLRQEKPFLFLCIMATSSYSNFQMQRQLGWEVKDKLFRLVMLENKTSLELLQGLMVFLSRYYFHFTPKTQQLYLLLGIAMSLLVNLGLDKNPRGIDFQKVKVDICEGPFLDQYHGIPGLRCLAGCFYLTVTTATSFRKRANLKYHPWMEAMFQQLSDNPEFPTDRLIKPFVDIQALAERIGDCLNLNDGGEPCGQAEDPPMIMSIRSFRGEIQRLKQSIGPALMKQNHGLNTELLHLDVYLHEISLHGDWMAMNTGISRSRLDLLWQLLHNCKMYLDNWLDIPSHEMCHLTTTSFAQCCYVFILLSKLVHGQSLANSEVGGHSSLDRITTDHIQHSPSGAPNWDSELARKEANAEAFIKAMHIKVESISSPLVDSRGDRDAFFHFSILMGAMLAWYKKAISGDEDPGPIPMENIPVRGLKTLNEQVADVCLDGNHAVRERVERAGTEQEAEQILEEGGLPDLPTEMFNQLDLFWQMRMDDWSMFSTNMDPMITQ